MTMTRDEAVRTIEHAATVLAGDGEPTIAANLIAALSALASDTGERGVDAKWLAVLDNHIAQLCVESPEDEAHRASMVQARDYFAALRAQPTSPPESGVQGEVAGWRLKKQPNGSILVMRDHFGFEVSEGPHHLDRHVHKFLSDIITHPPGAGQRGGDGDDKGACCS